MDEASLRDVQPEEGRDDLDGVCRALGALSE